MGLARPKTKAEQTATRSPGNEQSATHSKSNGQGVTLGKALTDWYTSLRAGTRVKSERTIRVYQYGTDKLVHSVGS